MSSLAVKREDDGGASAESKNSSAPLLNKTQQDTGSPAESDATAKPRKRDFWKLGKKPEEKEQKPKQAPPAEFKHSTAPQIAGLRPSSPFRMTESVGGSASPHRGSIPYASPGSPGYAMTAGASPRPHSPASSMIFERNVQDEAHPPEISPQIPSHVITENHIPPALDASAEAITNSKLDVDEVEIITHATHQPAAVTITGAAEHSMASSTVDELPPPANTLTHRISEPGHEDVSNYGSLDANDVRRLSFISFADVVHGEQEGITSERRDSAAVTALSGLNAPRSPSPMRSPVSSAAYGTSPPTSIATSAKGFEGSPNRGIRAAAGSPPLAGQTSPPLTAELNIETMRQALRRTGSGDLSGVRSAPLSAVGEGEGFGDKAFK
ncbi:uncharacterized protein AB675_8777 [Cyphellophora attinorum]|uniref:Uncharacterized protein n=1 Tax=Cyphellophora attinorum TaxID=1664694 RepID=A0A0N1HAC1_9EURO|nr:uncharacterized protein AB675_8777 [Phialophora attinorum]KPI44797.1 hypothetical protein AB675_8777 [Phialophora attinorum]